jgi:hypothetical protein
MYCKVSEKYTTSIFRAEDYAMQTKMETSKQRDGTSQKTTYSSQSLPPDTQI